MLASPVSLGATTLGHSYGAVRSTIGLADLAISAYPEAPFRFAAIGFEAFAFLAEESAAPDKILAGNHGAYVIPLDGVPHYFESTS